MPTHADPRLGALCGSFRLLRRVGKGGMGVVYEAVHQKIARRAAVKLLHARFAQDEQYAQRFLHEACAVNIIRHRGLVEIFEFGKLSDGTLFYVMEFLEGTSLQNRIVQRRVGSPPDEVIGLLLQLARALSAAHEKGIVHRDLKPDNIMLEPDPLHSGLDWAKILDFGIAKVRGLRIPGTDPDKTDVATQVGAFMGTPRYMAPEQHWQAERADGKADVFALGVIAWQMLTGLMPYQDTSLSLMTKPALPLSQQCSGVPKGLAELIDRMIAPTPAERPTMSEVTQRLTALAPRPGERARQHGLAAAGALAGIALLSLLIRVWWHGLPSPVTQARRTLAEYCQNQSPEVRSQALRAIGQSRDPTLIPLVQPLLTDPGQPPIVVEEAARALGRLGAMEAQATLRTLNSSELPPEIALAVASALAQLQDASGLASLQHMAFEGKEAIRVEAALGLLEHGDLGATSVLWAHLEKDAFSSKSHVQVLGRLALAGNISAQQKLSDGLVRLPDSEERVYVAHSLARLGSEDAYAHLRKAAGKQGPEQLLALRLLAGLADPEVCTPLLALATARDKSDPLRELAIEGLADSVREDRQNVLEAMAAILAESAASTRLRIAAASAIVQIAAGEGSLLAEQTLHWTRSALRSGSVSTRELAVSVLGELSSAETIAPLAQALQDPEQQVRKTAAGALGRKGTRTALSALAASLRDQDEDVRATAMQSIIKVTRLLEKNGDRQAASQVVPLLRQQARSEHERDRVLASSTLVELGEGAKELNEAMLRGLSAREAAVRRLTLQYGALERSSLVKALSDPDGRARFIAASRLAERGFRDGISVLREVAGGGSRDALVAYRTLRQLGDSPPEPVGLEKLYGSSDPATRLAIVDIVPELSESSAMRLLPLAVADPSPLIRRRMLEGAAALYRLHRHERFLQIVRSSLNDPDVLVRAQATSELGRLAATRRLPPSTAQAGPRAAPSEVRSPDPSLPPPQAAPQVGWLQLRGDELVRYKLDRAPGLLNPAKRIEVAPGKHRLSYLGGSQPVTVLAGQTVEFQIPVQLAHQLLNDSKEAIGHRDYPKAQDCIDKARRLVQRGMANPILTADVAFRQGQLFEARSLLGRALIEYNRVLSFRPAQRRSEVNSAIAATVSRLAGRVGRVQIYTRTEKGCVLGSEYLAQPGEQKISTGKGPMQSIHVRVGTNNPLGECQP